jgi:MFS family permease
LTFLEYFFLVWVLCFFSKPYEEPIFLFFSSCLVLAGYVFYSLKARNPILDLKIFKNVHFRISFVVFVIMMSSMMGSFLVGNFLFQDTFGLSPFETGVLSVPFCAGMMIVMRPLPKWYDRFGPVPVLAFGSIIFAISNGFMIFVQTPDDYILACVLQFIRGFGQGFLGLVLQSAAICSLKKEEMSHASSLMSISWYLAVSLGVAFFTLFLSVGMSLQGVAPISFKPPYENESLLVFRWVFLLTTVIYFIGVVLFFRLNNKEVKQIIKESKS